MVNAFLKREEWKDGVWVQEMTVSLARERLKMQADDSADTDGSALPRMVRIVLRACIVNEAGGPWFSDGEDLDRVLGEATAYDLYWKALELSGYTRQTATPETPAGQADPKDES